MKKILVCYIIGLVQCLSVFGFSNDTSKTNAIGKKYSMYIGTGIYNNYNKQLKELNYLKNPGFSSVLNLGIYYQINKRFKIGTSLVYNYSNCSLNSGVYFFNTNSPFSDSIINQKLQKSINEKVNRLGVSLNFNYIYKRLYVELGFNYFTFLNLVVNEKYNNYTFNIEKKYTNNITLYFNRYYPFQYKLSAGFNITKFLSIEGSFLAGPKSPYLSHYVYTPYNNFWSKSFKHLGFVINYLIIKK
jgi:hypothetical protein